MERTETVERLTNLKRVLSSVRDRIVAGDAKTRFDMSGFADENACGTTCCAAGWCGMDPYFRKLGIVTGLLGSAATHWFTTRVDGVALPQDVELAPKFGISEGQAWGLFFTGANGRDLGDADSLYEDNDSDFVGLHALDAKLAEVDVLIAEYAK